jgi:hypothetical protein
MTREKARGDSRKRAAYRHSFVETLPEKLDEGVLYVSIQYATAAHNCFCGCGREVVTPLHPTKWRLTFDGLRASLYPSVGSWALPCKSHYWLEGGAVSWAEGFSDEDIETVRARDAAAQERYFVNKKPSSPAPAVSPSPVGFWGRLGRRIRGQ